MYGNILWYLHNNKSIDTDIGYALRSRRRVKTKRPGKCGDSLVGHCHGSPRGVLVLVISMGIFHEITMVS